MGSKISIQDIDRQAEIHARNELISRREKENEKLREQIQSDTIVYAKIRKENKELKDERKEILILCEKLDKEIQRLVDEVNEPKELDDK